ncbi:hypothetical protein [Kitasatospora sp. NPDC088134]|uniref:hypothetical protein n=1 Tax=Kitasatospora sp. NPDC088134 TaxID=3364071 RepID=UPI003819FCF1
MSSRQLASADLLTAWSEAFDLTPEALHAVGLAGEHLDAAEALDMQVERDGLMVPGDRGGMKLHPAVAEARHQRSAAVAVLRAMVPPPPDEAEAERLSKSSQAQRAARARWSRG